MPKFKAGLHKDVSAIFDGVPAPKKDGAHEPSERSWHGSGYSPPKPGAPGHVAPAVLKARSGAQSPAQVEEIAQEKIYTETRLGPAPRQQRGWQQIRKKLFAPKAGVSAKRQKTMTLLVPILFVALILVLVRVVGIPSFKSAGAVRTTKGPATASGMDPEFKLDWQVPAVYPATLRDPMKVNLQEVSVAGGKVVGVSVKGIVYAEDRPSAIIGSAIVHEGDTVSGATIIRIRPGSVEFEMNGKRWTEKVQ
jgi:hypothetical protein